MYKISLNDLPHGICGIYLLEINDKKYIGQSIDIKERIRHHNLKCINETVVDKAINKYGKVKDVIILEEIDKTDKELMNQREQYWIECYQTLTTQNGYNVSIGGQTGNKEGNLRKLFDNNTVKEIINLIKNTDIRFTELSKKYNCHINVIQSINQGKGCYHLNNLNYPIRDKEYSRILRSIIPKETLLLILKDLKETTLTMTEIGEKYNLCRNVISDINCGKKQPISNYDYPARETKKYKKQIR